MPKKFKRRYGGRTRAPKKYARAQRRAGTRNEESPPRGGREYGAIRIKLAGRTVVIWNNTNEPVVIEPGRAIKLEVIDKWVKELDYRRVVGIEAELVGEASASGARGRSDNDAHEPEKDAYEWI